MLNLLNALSFRSGAVVVAAISALITAASTLLRPKALAWAVTITGPLAVAVALYWLPVLFGAESSGYSSWAVIFILPWYLSGALASVLTATLLGRRSRTR